MRYNKIYQIVIFILIVLIGNDCSAQYFKKIILKETLSIGSEESDILYQWSGVCTDDEGNIYVTDFMDYSIKKFDPKGNFIKKTGSRGHGPGEFTGPTNIQYCRNKLYISDLYKLGISVYDKDLNYQRDIYTGNLIMHFRILDLNRLLIAPRLLKLPLYLTFVDTNGCEESVIELDSPGRGDYITRGLEFEIDDERNIYIMYRSEDLILKMKNNGSVLWKTKIFGNIKAEVKEFRGVKTQTEILFKSIQLDSLGNVFVLGGHESKNKSRDIYVLSNKDGHHVFTLTLPEPTHIIYISSNNYLYSRAAMGTCLKQYKIIYK